MTTPTTSAAPSGTVGADVGRRLHAERCAKIARREAEKFQHTNPVLCAMFVQAANQYDAQASNAAGQTPAAHKETP